MKGIVICALLLINCIGIQGENIVIFIGFGSYSHGTIIWPLVEILAERGHNVTFISAFTRKEQNHKVHVMTPKSLTEFYDMWDTTVQLFEDRKSGAGKASWFQLVEMDLAVCEMFLSDPEVIEWINSARVDLVLIDALFNDCGYAIAHKNNAKHMIFGTTTVFPWNYDAFGLTVESSWIPDNILGYSQDMTFMEKVYTTVSPLYWYYLREWKLKPKLEALIKEKLNLEVNLVDMERETSLILVNTYFAEEFARSLPPLVVPVGGMHCKDKTQPLPKSMEEFVSKPATKGFIYISFGSCVKISEAPSEIKNVFFDALKKFKDFQFIWKWEGDFPKVQLPNVKFVNWANLTFGNTPTGYIGPSEIQSFRDTCRGVGHSRSNFSRCTNDHDSDFW